MTLRERLGLPTPPRPRADPPRDESTEAFVPRWRRYQEEKRREAGIPAGRLVATKEIV
jgi:hypothetical protein